MEVAGLVAAVWDSDWGTASYAGLEGKSSVG